MSKNKIAIFIISHERAKTQLTYNLLKKCNYTGDTYIIVDSEDRELGLYKELYPKELIVFDKEVMLHDTDIDTVDNFNNKKTALLPSNYCFDLAKALKINYFLKLDDDFKDLMYRYVDKEKLKSSKIKSLDNIIAVLLNYMENTKVDCLSFGNAGSYIGGANGRFKNKIGRNNAGSFLFRTDTKIRFLGTRQEDYNIVAKYSQMGKLFFEILDLCITTSKRGDNIGGCAEDYKDTGMYVVNFYSIIVAPNCTKIGFKKDFNIKRNYNAMCPKIISERWKK